MIQLIKRFCRFCVPSVGVLVITLVVYLPNLSYAEDKPTYELSIQNHLFYPDVVNVKAMQSFIIKVHNLDTSTEEFESSAMNINRIIGPGQTAVLHINPLHKGEYSFTGAFHSRSASGKVVVE